MTKNRRLFCPGRILITRPLSSRSQTFSIFIVSDREKLEVDYGPVFLRNVYVWYTAGSDAEAHLPHVLSDIFANNRRMSQSISGKLQYFRLNLLVATGTHGLS